MIRCASFAILLGTSVLSFATTLPLAEKDNDIVGSIQYIHAKKGQTIYNVAQTNDLGFYELIEANPNINRHSAISPEETITLPTEYILPNVPLEGIVINLPELRLYYYPTNCHCVMTFPIAIGRYEWKTPTVTTSVINKEKDPYWKVPDSIKEAAAKKGKFWPDVVPPGPENPLGKFALRLGYESYLIHGTNEPDSIGKRASSGCIRLYPQDIEQLFTKVPVGTPVRIVDEWFKLGWHDATLYIEIHEPLAETARTDQEQQEEVIHAIQYITQGKNVKIDWTAVKKALDEKTGVPTQISNQGFFEKQTNTHTLSEGLYQAN